MSETFPPQLLGDVYDEEDVFTAKVGSGGVTQGHGVAYSTNFNEVIIANGATAVVIGIALETKSAGDYCSFLHYRNGVRYTRAVAGAAIAGLYTNLTTDSTGRFVGASGGNNISGINLSTASGADVGFTIELGYGSKPATA